MSSVPTNMQLIPNAVQVGNAACEGRKAITTIIDFSLGLTFTLDLSGIQQQLNWFRSVQTIYVDNSANVNPFVITCGITTQRIVIPPYCCAYMPLLQPDAPVLQFNSANAVAVKIQLLNFFLPPSVWSVAGGGQISPGGLLLVSDPILDSTVVNSKVNVNAVPFPVQGLTDASGTIAVGGTAQIAIPAAAARQRWFISNPATATEPLIITIGGAAIAPVSLLAGQTWDENGSSIIGDAIYVNATTLGHAFSAMYK